MNCTSQKESCGKSARVEVEVKNDVCAKENKENTQTGIKTTPVVFSDNLIIQTFIKHTGNKLSS